MIKVNSTIKMNFPKIRQLTDAQGGYVKPNTPQLAMIGDNRHQGEVVAPEGKLLEMARAAAELSGGDSAKTEKLLQELIELIKNLPVVELDPEAIRKYFIRKTNQNTKARMILS